MSMVNKYMLSWVMKVATILLLPFSTLYAITDFYFQDNTAQGSLSKIYVTIAPIKQQINAITGYMPRSIESYQCFGTNNDICSKDAVACNAVYDVPSCPNGTLDPVTHLCISDPVIISGPDGWRYDSSLDTFFKDTLTCPAGGSFDKANKRCVVGVVNSCSDDVISAGYTKITENGNVLCIKDVATICGSSATYSSVRDRCELLPQYYCAAGYEYNRSLSTQSSTICTMIPICPADMPYNAVNNRCEKSINDTMCQAGYKWDSVNDYCYKDIDCTFGGQFPSATYNSSLQRCQILETQSCTSPYWSMVNEAGKNVCIHTLVNSDCSGSGATYNTTLHKCVTASTGNSCPDGALYVVDGTSGKCVATPLCPDGSYDATSKKCLIASTKVCPPTAIDATYGISYTYQWDATLKQCYISPICPADMPYNAVNNRCEKVVSCANGYKYDVANNRCYQDYVTNGVTDSTSSCKTGTLVSANNRCEANGVVNCPAGYLAVGNTYACQRTKSYLNSGEDCPTPSNISGALSMDFSIDKCYYNSSLNECPSGYLAVNDTVSGQSIRWCKNQITSSNCASGTYNATTNRCETGNACSSVGGTWDSVTQKCTTTSITDPTQGSSVIYSGYNGVDNGNFFDGYCSSTCHCIDTYNFPSGKQLTMDGYGYCVDLTTGASSAVGVTSSLEATTGYVAFNKTVSLASGDVLTFALTGGTTSKYVYMGIVVDIDNKAVGMSLQKPSTSFTYTIPSTGNHTIKVYAFGVDFGSSTINTTTTITKNGYQCPSGTQTVSCYPGRCNVQGYLCSASTSISGNCNGLATDTTNGTCYINPTCTGGATSTTISGTVLSGLDINGQALQDYCVATPNTNICDSTKGYSYANGLCVGSISCKSGGSYTTSTDTCSINPTSVTCDASNGYTNIAGSVACVRTPICPLDGSDGTMIHWDNTAHLCLKSLSCNGTLSGTTCYNPISCGSGVGATFINDWKPSTDICAKSITPTCSTSGYTLSGTDINYCNRDITVAKDCPGTNASRAWEPAMSSGKCTEPWLYNCDVANGYMWDSSSNQCVKDPNCNGGAFENTQNRCSTSIGTSCSNAPFTQKNETDPSNSNWKCQTTSFPDSGSFDACPNGTLKPSTQKCDSQTAVCGSNSLDTVFDRCYTSLSCGADDIFGTQYYSTSNKVCARSGTVSCLQNGTTYLYGPEMGSGVMEKCVSSSICMGKGSYSSTRGRCENQSSITNNCPTSSGYIFTNGSSDLYDTCTISDQTTLTQLCNNSDNLSMGTNYDSQILRHKLNDGTLLDYTSTTVKGNITFSQPLGACTTGWDNSVNRGIVSHVCPDPASYNFLHLYGSKQYNKCIMTPICNAGVFVSEGNGCFTDQYTCPIGNYSCKNGNNNTKWCSPYECNTKGVCGFAKCTTEQSAILGATDLSQCYSLSCLLNKPYNEYCGQNSCPSGFGVYSENGKCYQNICPTGSTQASDGSCQTLMCPQGTVEVGGQCVVK